MSVLDVCSVDKTGCEAIITQRALVFLSAVASRFRSCGGSAENFVVMLLNDAFHVIHTAVANFNCVKVDEHTSYKIHWTILAKAAAYNNKTKRCNLCLTEKLHIIRADTSTLLNKRSELISKCRHENKFLLKNLS